MKKLIAMALLASSSVVMADQDVGCGLGSMVWAGQSGVAPKILRQLPTDMQAKFTRLLQAHLVALRWCY